MDPLTDLFTPKPPVRDGDEWWWVSKTDVTSYERCPWAFWLVDSGQLASSAILDVAAVRRFIEEGIAFESEVQSTAEVIAAGEVPTMAHHGENVVLGMPVVHNSGLGLVGAPDGVWAAGGVMAPVEVKSHRKKIPLDEIELCFYWDLLAPWRTLHVDPVGLLVLPEGPEGFRLLEVELSDERFAQMRTLVDAVRRVRREPPKARICTCIVCSKIEARRVFEECRARGDLTLLSGLGPRYATALEEAGIPNLVALQRLKPIEVVAVLRKAGHSVSRSQVAAWIHHATAFETGKPVIFGLEPFKHREFIALDLEYDTWTEGTPLWLAGAEVVTDGGRQQVSFWADPGEERTLLEGLAGLLSDYPELPIVTWNGHSADIPHLRKACNRWDMAELKAKVENRHVDLYLYVKSSVRFPVEKLTLKLVAAQLGLVRDPSVSDGLDATAAWAEYTRSLGTDKATRLRRRLTRYNLEDVAGIVMVALAVQELTSGTTGGAVRSLTLRL